MFEEVEATRFDRVMSVGRTKPMLLACEGRSGEVEVVCKFSEGCSVGGLIREAMTDMLARDIGLPVPQPFLVRLSSEFVESIHDKDAAAMVSRSDVFGFGSQRLPDGYRAWIPSGDRMTRELEQEALEIFTVDCWLTNPDRRVTNPNLLTNGRAFAIFDHELALMTALNLFWREPWKLGALCGSKPPIEHVFFEHLQARPNYQLATLCERLAGLTNARIAGYSAALPSSWAAADFDAIQCASRFIMDLRTNYAAAATELRRALA